MKYNDYYPHGVGGEGEKKGCMKNMVDSNAEPHKHSIF